LDLFLQLFPVSVAFASCQSLRDHEVRRISFVFNRLFQFWVILTFVLEGTQGVLSTVSGSWVRGFGRWSVRAIEISFFEKLSPT